MLSLLDLPPVLKTSLLVYADEPFFCRRNFHGFKLNSRLILDFRLKKVSTSKVVVSIVILGLLIFFSR